MIRILGVARNQRVESGLSLEDVQSGQHKWYWIDFSQPTSSEAELLLSFFEFHPLAVEDCLYVLQRPKVDYYEEYQFLVLHALNANSLSPVEVDLFIGEKYLVSYHGEDLNEINQAWEHLLEGAHDRKVWSEGPYAAAYMIIDRLVDQYFPCVHAIEDELDELEKLGSRESVDVLMNQVFHLRSRLLKLRRTIVPMRDLMYRVLNSQHIQGNKEPRVHFSDIHDHLLKLSEMIDSNREMTADLRDSYISLNANRMNGIMKTLTVITTVFMPLTFIAGLYGMNFDYMPELKWRFGYFAVLGIMVILSGWMIIVFHKRGWFK